MFSLTRRRIIALVAALAVLAALTIALLPSRPEVETTPSRLVAGPLTFTPPAGSAWAAAPAEELAPLLAGRSGKTDKVDGLWSFTAEGGNARLTVSRAPNGSHGGLKAIAAHGESIAQTLGSTAPTELTWPTKGKFKALEVTHADGGRSWLLYAHLKDKSLVTALLTSTANNEPLRSSFTAIAVKGM